MESSKGRAVLWFVGLVVLCGAFFVLGIFVGGKYRMPTPAAPPQERAAAEAPSPTPPEEPAPVAPAREPTRKAPDVRTQLNFPERVTKKEVPRARPPQGGPTFWAQVGAVKARKDADLLVKKLQALKYGVEVQAPLASEANPYFRVRVGPYQSRAAAELAQRKLKSDGFPAFVRVEER